ncbi:MAG: DNA-directed RNA polymerase subunit alpha [Christensenellaceae bacterium]|jgi:DNA-directed RNA polymerase subunit alpha|nr:DNA-directed RNA polymerase subunit alpha [Christensenellaceae bacterium]
MLEILKPKLVVEEIVNRAEATFVVEPLERGYGITIGNALRRILSTALPGVAIIGVKIENVAHEFSTLPGVREDMCEIILNLKEVAIKTYNADLFEQHTVILRKQKPGIVTAGDIEVTSDIGIMNPNAYICTLDEGGSLNMEITIGSGRGYVSAKENKNPRAPIGYIPIDSLFSPVLAVSYNVESTRVEQSIDYDKLCITVKTNASSTPCEAISLAAKIMEDHLRPFIDLVDTMSDVDTMIVPETGKPSKTSGMTIEELDLSVRPLNCLKRAGISTVDDLLQKDADEMLKVRNLGKKSLEEVVKRLELMGLGLNRKDN